LLNDFFVVITMGRVQQLIQALEKKQDGGLVDTRPGLKASSKFQSIASLSKQSSMSSLPCEVGEPAIPLCMKVCDEFSDIDSTNATEAGSESIVPCVEIGFKTAEGGIREVLFTSRPLGVVFHRGFPLQVREVYTGGHAVSLGVEIGWQLISINGEGVDGWDAGLVHSNLRDAVCCLPEF